MYELRWLLASATPVIAFRLTAATLSLAPPMASVIARLVRMSRSSLDTDGRALVHIDTSQNNLANAACFDRLQHQTLPIITTLES